jgi:RNA polymerase sigma-70 factor (ECF subfamily)
MTILTQERDAIHAARQGNLEAFNRLVLAYQDALFSLACRLAPPGMEAEKLTQAAVQQMYRALPAYRGGDFRLWAFKILVGVCRQAWMTRRAGGKNGSSQGSAVNNQAAERSLLERLNQLPFEQRLVATLVDIEGLDYAQAAEVLEITTGEIRNRLARARQSLCLSFPDVVRS